MSSSFQTIHTQKEVDELIMRKESGKIRQVNSLLQNGIARNVTFLKYSCPKQNNCRDDGILTFEKGSGLTSPFRHLVKCLCDRSKDKLLQCIALLLLNQVLIRRIHSSTFLVLLLILKRKGLISLFVIFCASQPPH